MSLAGFQRRRRELAKRKELEKDKNSIEELSIEDMTKDEIIEDLKEKDIEHNPKDKKEVLFDLLVRGE